MITSLGIHRRAGNISRGLFNPAAVYYCSILTQHERNTVREYLGTLGDVATAAGAVITVLTLIALLVKGATYLADLPRRVRTYFFYKPRYILTPTPEEMAKYCEKSFDGYKPNSYERLEELQYAFVKMDREFRNTSRSRVKIMYNSAFVVSAIFISRLFYLGIVDDESGALSRFDLAISIYVFFTIIFAFFLFKDDRSQFLSSIGRTVRRFLG